MKNHLLVALSCLCLSFSLPAVVATNYIYRTSNTPAHSSALGVDTYNAVVTVGRERKYGLYISSKPSSQLGTDMNLSPGMVLLTIDGYSVTSAGQADRWVRGRPRKPMAFTYAILVTGRPQVMSTEIASKSVLSPDSGSTGFDKGGATTAREISTSELEAACISMINESRRSHGLNPVSQDSQLGSLARKYSEYMAAHPEGYEISVSRSPHIDLQGRSPQQRASEAGVAGNVMENIGRGSRGAFTPDMGMLRNLHKSMMDEGPGGGHYETIMNPQSTRVGVGVARLASRFYLTEEFSN